MEYVTLAVYCRVSGEFDDQGQSDLLRQVKTYLEEIPLIEEVTCVEITEIGA